MNKIIITITFALCCCMSQTISGLTQKQIQDAYEKLLELRKEKQSKAEQAYQKLLEKKEELQRLTEKKEQKEKDQPTTQSLPEPEAPPTEPVLEEKEPIEKDTPIEPPPISQTVHQSKPKPRPSRPQAAQQPTNIVPVEQTNQITTIQEKETLQSPPQQVIETAPPPIQPTHGHHETVKPTVIEEPQIDREVSLSIFSALIPLLAANNAERIIGFDLQNGTLREQKYAAQNIETFLIKLEGRLKRLKKTGQKNLMHSPQFKKMTWAQDLFNLLETLYKFCDTTLQSYQKISDKPTSVTILEEMFNKNKSHLKRLCKKYFSYKITK